MTLSERLAKAKTERLIAAGLLHSEAALKPAAEDEKPVVDPYDLSQPIVIESPAEGLHPVAPVTEAVDDEAAALVRAAQASVCPTCRRPGKVDMVDLVGHTTHMTCPTCRTMWQVRDTDVPSDVNAD